MLRDDAPLELPVLLEPVPALDQPLGPTLRNLLGSRRALGLERLLRLAQPRASIAARAQPLGQLVAARLAVELVLGRIDPSGLLEDLLRDLLIATRRTLARSRRDLRAVKRDDPDLHQPRLRTQLEH